MAAMVIRRSTDMLKKDQGASVSKGTFEGQKVQLNSYKEEIVVQWLKMLLRRPKIKAGEL